MKYYKDDFEKNYLGNPFLSYKFRFKNMTIWGKFCEILSWSWAVLVTIVIILIILLLFAVAFTGVSATFLG